MALAQRLMRRGGDDRGFTAVQLVVYIGVGSLVIATLGGILYTMFIQNRAVTEERSQTSAVQSALQQMVRAVDESSTVMHATETELGIGRNVTNEDSGGVDCRIDQFFVGTVDGEEKLMQWVDTQTGACVDLPVWTDTSTLSGDSVMVHDLAPYTLVDDEGLTTAACTATATETERGEDGYCVPLFRFLDTTGSEFTPSTPPAKNSISAVKIVLSGNFHTSPVPVSRSKTVSPNSYRPDGTVGDVVAPSCPSSLTRSLSDTTVSLSWSPVPNATSYRVVRSHDGTTTTVSDVDVASMPSASNPSFDDDISGMAATSIVYQVIPTVGGEEANGCPQTIVSIQVESPDVMVQVLPGNDDAWNGARVDDTSFDDWPSLRASWPDVAGASHYEAEIREMDPSDDSAPLSGWAAFDWDGGSTPSNLVSDSSVTTDEWGGDPLFSRAFQVRVRAVSDAGSSPWTFCYMESGSGTAGECNSFPGNSFPTGGYNGYLVMPAPPIVAVDDVTRAYVGDNAALSWGDSPAWSDTMYNRDTTTFRVQRDERAGTDSPVSYDASDYADVYTTTDATTGVSGVDPGDWSDFRAQRCNSINPYGWGALGAAYGGSGPVHCGPSSRVWSALGLPSVPAVAASVNSGNDTNTVRWGKHSSVTSSDYSEQFVTHYDIAETQGGGPGTSMGSGNTSSAEDGVTGSAKSTPWRDDISATSSTHDRREGDFTRYAAIACNNAESQSATEEWLAGVTGEAGQGVGTESCSDWSSDTQRYWQALGAPACVDTDTWNTTRVRFDGTNGGVFLSSLDTITSRQVGRYNETANAGTWWRSTTDYTWSDNGSSSDSSQYTVKPLTYYTGRARIDAAYAGPGQNNDCGGGRVNYPPVPDSPSLSVSYIGINPSTGRPHVRKSWNDDDSPVSTNWMSVNRDTGSGYQTTSQNGSAENSPRWYTTERVYARAAYTSRLASWGFWSTASASRTMTPPGGAGACPDGLYLRMSGWASPQNGGASRSGSTCYFRAFASGDWDWRLREYYRDQVEQECNGQPLFLRPQWCKPVGGAAYDQEVRRRMNASPSTRTGDYIFDWEWSFGDPLGFQYHPDWRGSHPYGPLTAADYNVGPLLASYDSCDGMWCYAGGW
jgi:hypothetical protein